LITNVDAVAEDIVVIDDEVTAVNADAEFDPAIRRYRSILHGHAALDLTLFLDANRLPYAGKRATAVAAHN
jgi:hypothetical protein